MLDATDFLPSSCLWDLTPYCCLVPCLGHSFLLQVTVFMIHVASEGCQSWFIRCRSSVERVVLADKLSALDNIPLVGFSLDSIFLQSLVAWASHVIRILKTGAHCVRFQFDYQVARCRLLVLRSGCRGCCHSTTSAQYRNCCCWVRHWQSHLTLIVSPIPNCNPLFPQDGFANLVQG